MESPSSTWNGHPNAATVMDCLFSDKTRGVSFSRQSRVLKAEKMTWVDFIFPCAAIRGEGTFERFYFSAGSLTAPVPSLPAFAFYPHTREYINNIRDYNQGLVGTQAYTVSCDPTIERRVGSGDLTPNFVLEHFNRRSRVIKTSAQARCPREMGNVLTILSVSSFAALMKL